MAVFCKKRNFAPCYYAQDEYEDINFTNNLTNKTTRMKKIFTLIAVAAMAMGVQAQETYLIEEGFQPDNSGQKYKAGKGTNTTSVTFECGADGGWKAAVAYAGFDPFTAYVTGSQNPKDGDLNGSSSSGAGYTIEKKNLPKSGCYFIFTPTKSGALSVGMVLNANKSFYVVNAEDGTAISNFDIKDKDGNVVALRAFEQDAAQFASSENKVYGNATFNVEAGKSYYVFCTGSKLGLFGFTFSETAATIDPATTAAIKADIDAANGAAGIQGVKAENTANGAAFNLAGQQVSENYKGVVIKDGKKVVIK